MLEENILGRLKEEVKVSLYTIKANFILRDRMEQKAKQ